MVVESKHIHTHKNTHTPPIIVKMMDDKNYTDQSSYVFEMN